MLVQKGFNCVTPNFASEVTALGSVGKLQDHYPWLYIAKIDNDYGIFKDYYSAHEWLKSRNITSFQKYAEVNEALRVLGVDKTEDEQRKEAVKIINKEHLVSMDQRKEFDKIGELVNSLLGGDFEKALEEVKEALTNTKKEEEKKLDEVESFDDSLRPGYIVEFDTENVAYGIVLDNGMIVCLNKDGKVSGYLKKFTAETPCKIVGIYKPTDEAYTFRSLKNMEKVWAPKKEKVTYTKSEIEKLLGLEPGSLEIK